MVAPMEKVCLIDAEGNKEYKIILSSEDTEKARRGKYTIYIVIFL